MCCRDPETLFQLLALTWNVYQAAVKKDVTTVLHDSADAYEAQQKLRVRFERFVELLTEASTDGSKSEAAVDAAWLAFRLLLGDWGKFRLLIGPSSP